MPIEQDGTLDANASVRMSLLETKFQQVNASRSQMGLPEMRLPGQEPSTKKTKKQEKVYKYYHPTFNPHGKKKGKDVLEEQEEEEEYSSEEEGEFQRWELCAMKSDCDAYQTRMMKKLMIQKWNKRRLQFS
jgi:hypothetical protein